MSQDNQITLRGYLTQEPRLFQRTAEAIPVTEIRVGSTPRRLNRETGEWQEAPASYYTVKCWRRLAINAASSLHKGDTVIIRGRFYTNTWIDSQQQTRTSLEIEADSLGHDLAYGWSHFLRGVRQQSRDNGGGDGGELARQETSDTAEAFEASEAADAFDTPGGDGALGDLEAGLAASEAGLPDSLAGLAEPEAVPF
ncbi:single-stranded DNA-binding protein [Trebonia kvetii]|uniref:Single-stranded DNA-binding protein n=1 Tax=Trebonia kvetii TaxID=2480626 RepID=A0A6P2BLY7_9ACTN|nr:single-stranded DNA-binding protein [Trebonia kvetii]TVY99111.1 single-stranded DNA-binding protein [Trebonia kvetii]